MIKKLYPNFIYKSISDIEDGFFDKHNIKNVILDIDNTLVPYTSPNPDKKAIEFLEKLKIQNINVCLVSNNNKARVTLFNEGLNLHSAHSALKPLTFAITRAMKFLNALPSETAIIGDQIFTDVYGGNRAKITTILVDPIQGKETTFFKFKRKLERRVLEKMSKEKK